MDTCDKCGKRAELYHNEASGLAYCDACETASHEGFAYGESTEFAQIERWDGILGAWMYVAEVEDGADPLRLAEECRVLHLMESADQPKYRLVRIIRQELA